MKPRVLFVDDEPSVTAGIKTALRKAPFDVLTASSGADALSQLEQHAVDVVVSDERMPGMCGSELLSRVRDQYPDTVRMILSGQADLEAAVRAINEGGIFRFLLKPCDPVDLAASVTEALDSLQHRRKYHAWQSENPSSGSEPNASLDRALETLSMAFQPIFAKPGNRIYAYEALVRPCDPDVSDPGKLFGLAEATGRVGEVDRAIRQAIAERIPLAPPGASFFVNVHPESLLDGQGIPATDPLVPHAQRIVLEITERSSLHESDELEQCIARLRELGFRIALDDLGAGYAGLSSFALLTPDVVKFDMGLIRGIQSDPTRARLVESMAVLCSEMDILTVAEGVETTEEMRKVLSLGCDLIQGYLLGRPELHFPGEV